MKPGMVEVVGLVAAILLVLILLSMKKNLGLVMIAGSLVLTLFEGVSWLEGIGIVREALFSAVTLNLLVAIMGMGILGEIMYCSGGMEKSLGILKVLVKDSRSLVVILPSLIGLIAIPGGAYFSSPLVKDAASGIRFDSTQMALANVYFRHLFYAVFPLFSGFIAMINLSGIPPGTVIALTFVPMLFSLLLGFFYIFRSVEQNAEQDYSTREHFFDNAKSLLYGLSPLITAVVVFVVLGWPFWIGIFIGTAIAFLQYIPWENKKVELKKRLKCFYKSIPVRILTGVLGIMIFKEFIAQSKSLFMFSDYLVEIGIPIMIMFIIIPFLSGMATGNCLAALGISFPVLYPMLDMIPHTQAMMAMVYLSALWGYIISPVHLCLILTVEFFEVPLTRVMSRLLGLGAVVLAFSAVYLIIVQKLI